MRSRHLAQVLTLFGLLAASRAGAAVGARPSCPAVAVAADARFRARWPSLLERIQADFAARSDLDTCARVELSADGDGIGVSVTLPDGRVAARSVTRSVDVVPTLEALLVVP